MTSVFDIHHHIGPRDRMTGGSEDYDFDVAVDKHLRWMDDYGVEAVCLIASHNARWSGTDDVRWLNEKIAKVCAERPDRFPAGAGTVDPGLGDAGLKEIDFAVGELGLSAMAWHARFSGMPMDSPPIRRYVGRTAELNTPVLMHMMAESSFEAPWRLGKIAAEFPHATIVALDAFTSLNQTEWVVEVGGEIPNVSYELAVLRSCGSYLERFVQRYGADRLIFGSDYYDDARTRVPGALHEVAALDITAAEKGKIMGGNARRILGLDASGQTGARR